MAIIQVLYTARRKLDVLRMNPYIPVDETNERSAYSILLLHTDWGEGGEALLLGGCTTAVERLRNVKDTLKPHVLRSLQKRAHSETMLATSGQPSASGFEITATDFDLFMREQQDSDDDENAGSHQLQDLYRDVVEQSPPHTSSYSNMIHTPPEHMAYLSKFVTRLKETTSANHVSSYIMSEAERAAFTEDSSVRFEINNIDQQQQILSQRILRFNNEQARAYKIFTDALTKGVTGTQMIMFLSGEGGTGKSELIHSITQFTQILYGKTIGSFGSVLKTAPTGGASFNIRGSTWQSALGKTTLKRLTERNPISAAAAASLKAKARGTVLFILDELSLASCEDLHEISLRLQCATGRPGVPFGGLHVLLAGDFYQMQTMGGTPIVQCYIPRINKVEALQGRTIFTDNVTDYALLTQNCRAMSTNGVLSPLASFTTKARVGDITSEALATINRKVVNSIESAMVKAHPNAIWITSTHKRIRDINRQYALKQVQAGAFMRRIVADHVPTKIGIPRPTQLVRDTLYAVTGDPKGGRSTPMLTHIDLLVGTRVRLTRNISVENGLFNGAMGTVYGFVYSGSGPTTPQEFMPKCFYTLEDSEREIPIVLVQMDGNDESFPYSCSSSVKRLVPITALVGAKIKTDYHRVQLPLLPAHARTAHSVQGYTAPDGVVVDTGSMFFAGDYVAISRATDIDKVMLLQPATASNFASHPEYREMVRQEYSRLHNKYF